MKGTPTVKLVKHTFIKYKAFLKNLMISFYNRLISHSNNKPKFLNHLNIWNDDVRFQNASAVCAHGVASGWVDVDVGGAAAVALHRAGEDETQRRSMLLQPFLKSILAGKKFCLVLDLTNHMFITSYCMSTVICMLN